MIKVLNLATGEYIKYSEQITPRMAVICAYAQNKKDFNTADYEVKYDHLVKESKLTYFIQDFAAYKNQRMHDKEYRKAYDVGYS